MTTQYIIERMAELQLKEQEAKTRLAEYEAENARIRLEHVRRVIAANEPPPVAPPKPSGLPS